MIERPNKCPKWLESSLQALAFWMGYEHHLFPHHAISEGAIVNELRNILTCKMNCGLQVHVEYPYKTIQEKGAARKAVAGRPRSADLAIVNAGCVQNRSNSKKALPQPMAVIEVKRSRNILHDLKRLSDIRSSTKGLRCFLIVTSHRCRPRMLVDKSGRSRGAKTIGNQRCAIRRVCKATASFKRPSSAFYACAVEVLPV
jgi:hypothetical protein